MKNLTEHAVVAQMVLDAIMNDDRRKNGHTPLGYVIDRAKVWHERANKLLELGRIYYKDVVNDFGTFLCAQESNLGILDFWDGDVVEVRYSPREARPGVVKSIHAEATIHGGGSALVVFPDGEEEWCDWKYIHHAKIPQSILDISKAQFMATAKCPFAKQGE